tara:strand:+ start:381 stop:2309 length:1929 start_codon:yes stop_codon:yes gene_type:complete
MQKIYQDSTLYPNDLVKAATPYYYTISNPINSLLTRYIDMQIVFFAIFFIGNFFTFFMIFYISKLLFKNNKTALLSVLLFLTSKAALGGQATLFPDINQRTLGFPLILLSIYFFLGNKYPLAFITNGIALLFHGWWGIFLFSLYSIYFAINYKKVGFLNIAKYVSLFLSFSIPLLIWKLLTPLDNPFFEVPDLLLRIYQVFHYWHMFPFQWHIGKWLVFLAFLIAFVVAFSHRPLNKDHHKKILTFLLGIFILVLIGTIFAEIYPLTIVLTLHLYRVTILVIVFAIIYLSNFTMALVSRDNLGFKIVGAGLIASAFIGNFKGIYVFLLLFLALKSKSIIKIPLIFLAVLGFILGAIGTFVSGIPIISSMKFGTLPLLIITITCLFTWFLASFRNFKKISVHGMISAFTLFILVLSSFYIIGLNNIMHEYEGAVEGIYRGMPIGTLTQIGFIKSPYDPLSFTGISKFFREPFKIFNKNVQFPLEIPSNDFEDVQLWAKENTKNGAIFVTPPYIFGFRGFSERSIVGDCIDLAPANPVCIHGYIAIKRMEALCDTEFTDFDICREDNCRLKYNNLPEEKLLDISNKYESSYIVIEKPWSKNLDLVYENDKFRVYKVNNIEVEDSIPMRQLYSSLASLEGINGCF